MQQVTLWLHVSTVSGHHQANKEHFVKEQIGITQWDPISFTVEYIYIYTHTHTHIYIYIYIYHHVPEGLGMLINKYIYIYIYIHTYLLNCKRNGIPFSNTYLYLNKMFFIGLMMTVYGRNMQPQYNLLHTLLTAWCRVLLEKLTGLQLVKKFPAFYGNRRFITALTSVRINYITILLLCTDSM